jgi:methylmalonyl-CoA mutase
MMATTVSVNRDFPEVSEADWRALVARSLAGRDLADLTSVSDDGIPVGPIYGQRAGGGVVPGRQPGRWSIVQRIDLADMPASLAQIETDLAGGADAIDLVFATSPNARGTGLPDSIDADAIERLLAALPVGKVALRVDAGEATQAIGGRILDIGRRRTDPVSVALAFDPIATLAATGRLTRPYDQIARELAATAERFEQSGTAGIAAIADGRLWHAGGASEVQELAATVAALVAYLRLLTEAGIPAERAVRRLGLALAADADQFLTIAKFRAIRQLVGHVLTSAGIEATPLAVHAETAWRMMSRRSPHINILRTTTAAFAAGIAGADSVTVLPFNLANGVADALARRLARNSQTILMDEASLARVADPGAGAGAIEALTATLAERAWQKVRAIEAAGGLLAVIRSGSLQREVGAMREARLRRVAAHEIELIGASIFPDPGAPLPGVVPTTRGPETPAAEPVESLILTRLAEPFEG